MCLCVVSLFQVRVQKQLEKIRKLTKNIKKGTEDVNHLASSIYASYTYKSLFIYIDVQCFIGSGHPVKVSITLPSATSNILPLSFPKSTVQNTQQPGSASTQNTSFKVNPTEVKVQKQIPLMELKVHTHTRVFCVM